MPQILKFCIYISKLRLWVEFLVIFLKVVNGIGIHQLNLQPFRILKSLDEIQFKKFFFFFLAINDNNFLF
jgi:hypothetical protein